MGLSSVLAYALKMKYIPEDPVIESCITRSQNKAGASSLAPQVAMATPRQNSSKLSSFLCLRANKFL